MDLNRPLPDEWTQPIGHRKVVDRHDRVLAEAPIPKIGRSEWTELAKVHPNVIKALLAAEDLRFYEHWGIDPRGIARAAQANVNAGRVVQGGSTLTQQTARLMQPRRTPGMMGKLQEAYQALRLEAKLDKNQILTFYLNRAYFGRGATGIAAAAKQTFDQTPDTLSLSEAATLVGILVAPERYHPRLSLTAAIARRNLVLDRMLETGLADPDQVQRARKEPLQLGRPEPAHLAPHLTTRALLEPAWASDTKKLTIDLDIQQMVEGHVSEVLRPLASADVDHAAVLVVDRRTSEVLAWAGSGDWQADDGQNDGVLAMRSPGSTLKPMTYALAMEKGMTPATVLPDLPQTWKTTKGAWQPKNYDGSFSGPVTIRKALGSSLNIPAVVALEEAGVGNLHRRLLLAGVSLEKPASFYGLGLTLGGGSVSLEQLTTLYTAIATDGVQRPLRWFEGQAQGSERRILDPLVASLVADILEDETARIPGFGTRTPLTRSYRVAVKTGTSTDHRDNWTIGFTDDHVVGVWVGNFDGRPMAGVSGVTGAGPLWARIMDDLSKGKEFGERDLGPSVITQRVCALSGKPSGVHCPHSIEEKTHLRLDGSCDWHTAEGIQWPEQYQLWAQSQGSTDAGSPRIRRPVQGTQIYIDPRVPASAQKVPLVASGAEGLITWVINGERVGEHPSGEPWLWLPPASGRYTLQAVANGVHSEPVQIQIRGR